MTEARLLDDGVGDLGLAIKHLEQAVRLSPANPRYSGLLGEAWLMNADAEAALAPLQASLQAEFHPRVAVLMALALLHLERYEDAQTIATRAVEEASAFHRAYLLRADARIGLGDTPGAVEDLRSALAVSPDNDHYRLRLASLLVGSVSEVGELAEARTLLEGMNYPDPTGARNYLLGCIMIEQGEPSAALDTLDGISWPTAAEVELRRGFAHLALGQGDAARSSFQFAQGDEALAEQAMSALRMVDEGDDQTLSGTEALPCPTARVQPTLMMSSTQVLAEADETGEDPLDLASLQTGGLEEADSARHLALENENENESPDGD